MWTWRVTSTTLTSNAEHKQHHTCPDLLVWLLCGMIGSVECSPRPATCPACSRKICLIINPVVSTTYYQSFQSWLQESPNNPHQQRLREITCLLSFIINGFRYLQITVVKNRQQDLLPRYIVERIPAYDVECRQTAKKSRVVQCQWKTRHTAPINMLQHLSVFDFTGQRKECRTLNGRSITFTGRQLKFNVEYDFQIGAASTKVILRGELREWNIHDWMLSYVNGFT